MIMPYLLKNPRLLTFLIKSIMNKKLFSWKALAGLALLVAMGLTSCKQSTEVDPNDPYNTTKPVQPGVVTGTADLNINAAVPSDVKAQFDSWWAGLDATKKKSYTDKSEFTIQVKSSVKLDGSALTVPTIWGTSTGKIVNVILSGAFTDADKAALNLDADLVAGGLVNFILPAGSYNVNLKATAAQTSMASTAGATIGTLDATVAAGKNGLSLKDGIVVNGYKKSAGDVALNGGAIVALVADGVAQYPTKTANTNSATLIESNAKDKGFKISDGVFVKSVIVTADGITVNPWSYNLQLDKITVAEGKTVTVQSNPANDDNGWNGEPRISEIAGLGDNGAIVTVQGPDALKNMTAISKVKILGAAVDLNVTSDIFTKTTFATQSVVLSAPSMAGSTFATTNGITINVDAANKTYSFASVDFGTNKITMNNTAKKDIGTSNTQWFQWDASTSAWVEIEDASKVSAANKALQPDALSFTTDLQISMTGTTPSTELAKKLAGKYWFSITTNYSVSVAAADMKTIVAFDKCKASGKLLEPATLESVFSAVSTWFQPMFNGVQLKWFWDSVSGKYIAGAAE
ncbi:MAG: hypothetical protein J5931_01520 [Prevotella sp.]|nr:hypothetical protein [Prevotella sp.]